MASSYLIRIDDFCPTMPWDIWHRYEEILVANKIRPILAVIPDNQDKELHHHAPNDKFWDHVRDWQERGWTIALHGHQHLYSSKSRGLTGIQRYSEFAGLPFELQYEKLRQALAIFERERVHPDLWIAPNHTFDENTIRALIELGVSTISDGFHLYPHVDARGVFWIPQQLGDFHEMPFGLWTVCIHLNDGVHADTERFAKKIESFRFSITDVPEVMDRFSHRRSNFFDNNFARILRRSKQTAVTLHKMI